MTYEYKDLNKEDKAMNWNDVSEKGVDDELKMIDTMIDKLNKNSPTYSGFQFFHDLLKISLIFVSIFVGFVLLYLLITNPWSLLIVCVTCCVAFILYTIVYFYNAVREDNLRGENYG